MTNKLQTQQTLWCLPYDTDSTFKPFLKVSFSSYLNNIISNKNFAAYQQAMLAELKNQSAWNQKCWKLIQFFQFLNENFEITKWDDYISFIEDNTLRSTMGLFRLWIDTERLYLLNFLKLDSNQFQEDRIYMSLYRTLIYFNNLFSEYMFNDFDLNFLNNFIRNCTTLLQKLGLACTNETNQLITYIITLLANIKKREKFLLDPNIMLRLRKGAAIKVGKESEIIRDVENRLTNSAGFKKKIDEEMRLKTICKPGFIDELTASLKTFYDPIHKIKTEFEGQYYGTEQQKQRKRQAAIDEQIMNYKSMVKNPDQKQPQFNLYEEIDKNLQNPYQSRNYQIYGEAVKINMDHKMKYQKQKEAEVVSVEDYDRSKFYYDQKFIRDVETAENNMGRITVKDINLNNKVKGKKTQQFKSTQDQNTKVFNLKWHQDQSNKRKKSIHEFNAIAKDYDNNLLFKSPLQQQILQNRRNNLDKLRQNLGTKTYTMALYEQLGNQIHPDYVLSSFGSDYFIKKAPQLMDLKGFKLVNQNKFDFMRKVVGYMTVQKKIKSIIAEKNVPQFYPRYFSDAKEYSYNPVLQHNKVQFSLGATVLRPEINL